MALFAPGDRVKLLPGAWPGVKVRTGWAVEEIKADKIILKHLKNDYTLEVQEGDIEREREREQIAGR